LPTRMPAHAAAAAIPMVSATVGRRRRAADLTAWTNGHQIWCTQAGQRLTWAAADIEAAATRLAALARPAEGS